MSVKRRRPRKMRRRGAKANVFLAVALGLGCVLFVADRFSDAKIPIEQPPAPVERVASDRDTIRIPVPMEPIARGTRLATVGFTMAEWPKTKVSPNYIRGVEGFKDTVALTFLPAYTPVSRNTVSSKPLFSNAVAEKIPEGMRAITVTVDVESAIEGWVQSGSYVDVIALKTNRVSSEVQASVIAENVKILSAGRSSVSPTVGEVAPTVPQTVTLLCSQEDALKIKMASTVGRLTFSLRGVADESPTTFSRLSHERLFNGPVAKKPRAVRYVGKAKGPDGEEYYLSGDSKSWVRATKDLKRSGENLKRESKVAPKLLRKKIPRE